MATDSQQPEPAERPSAPPLPPPSKNHVFVKKGLRAGMFVKPVR